MIGSRYVSLEKRSRRALVCCRLAVLALQALCAVLPASRVFGLQPLPTLSVSVNVQPAVVPVGQTSYYTLELTGAAQAQPFELPTVPGLRVVAASKTQRFTRTHGQHSVCAAWQYALSPQRPGSYTIPSFPIQVGQRQLIVPACQLAAHDPQCLAIQEEPLPGGLAPLVLGMDLRLEGLAPHTVCYVGQALKAHISLRLPAGLGLAWGALGQPQRLGHAFACLAAPAQPSSQCLCRDDLVLQEWAWQETLVPLVPGHHTLQYQLGFRVPVYYTSAFAAHKGLQHEAFGSPAAGHNPLAQQHHALQWQTPVLALEVLPLPPPPPGVPFCGVLGSIDAAMPLCPQSVRAGEPFSLLLTLQGTFTGPGVQLPSLSLPAGVTTSTQKLSCQVPKPHVVVQSPALCTTTYTLVAQQAGTLQLPSLVFCSFDPQAAQYTTHTVNFPPITVLPVQDALQAEGPLEAVHTSCPPEASPGSPLVTQALPCAAPSSLPCDAPLAPQPEQTPAEVSPALPALQSRSVGSAVFPAVAGFSHKIGFLGSRSFWLLVALGAIVWILYRWWRVP